MLKKISFLILILSLNLWGEPLKEIRLEESVISTEDFETNVRDTPSNISIITKDEIETTGAKDLVDALRNVPGLLVKEYAGGDIRFDLRGQNPMYANKNIIVTVDGIPLNAIGGGASSSYSISQIPMETIEKIEVIPNSGGVLYGSGAIGGIINIITKSAKQELNYGSLSMKIGSNNLYEENLDYGTMIGDKFLTSVGITQYNSKAFRDDEDIEKLNTRFSGKYLLEDGEIEFKYNYSKGSKDLGTTIPYYMDNKEVINLNKRKYEYNDFQGKYRKEINENVEFLLSANYLHNDSSPYDKKLAKYKTNIYKERKEYIRSQFKVKYLTDSHIILGGDLSYHTDSESTADRGTLESKKDNYGLFVLNKINYNKFQFTQGIRRDFTNYDFYYKKLTGVIPADKWYQKDNKKFNNTSIELAANYLYSETGSAYLSYAQAFRTPDVSEIGTFQGEPESQTTNTIELGIKEYINDTYLSASVYYTKSNNYLYSKIPLDPDEWDKSVTANIGKVNKIGAELYMEHYFDKLTVRGGVTYLHHEIKSNDITNGKELPSVPNWKLTLGTTYNFTPNFSVGADALYHGSIYNLDYLKYLDTSVLPSTGPESNLSKYEEKVKSYITLDIFSSYRINDNLLLTARIDNVFDEQYARYVGAWGWSPLGDEYVIQQKLPAPGRVYTVSIKYSF